MKKTISPTGGYGSSRREFLRNTGGEALMAGLTGAEPHPLAEHLFQVIEYYEPENDVGLDDYFRQVRKTIPLLQEE